MNLSADMREVWKRLACLNWAKNTVRDANWTAHADGTPYIQRVPDLQAGWFVPVVSRHYPTAMQGCKQ